MAGTVKHRAIKYRLCPTESQAEFFRKNFGCCRKVYNLMLGDMIKSYSETGKFCNVSPAMYKDEFPYLREADSHALASSWTNLQAAFRNCFDKNRKVSNGFPKFKSAKRSRKSYTTNNQKGYVAVTDGYIKLPKVKYVKAVIHRLPGDTWKIKSATVSMDGDGRYFCSVLFEYKAEALKPALSPDRVIGLDFSVPDLFTDSNGNKPGKPKYYREMQKRLAVEQKKLSRRKGSRKGEEKSRNWYKQYRRVNRIHSKIRNRRNDFLHKASLATAKQYDAVCIEDISLKDMLQSRKYADYRKSAMDNGWNEFVRMLEYKLSDRGKVLIVADKLFPSTQTCHVCGSINHELTDDRIRKWICPCCGAKHDRDVNAAINLRNYAVREIFA